MQVFVQKASQAQGPNSSNVKTSHRTFAHPGSRDSLQAGSAISEQAVQRLRGEKHREDGEKSSADKTIALAFDFSFSRIPLFAPERGQQRQTENPQATPSNWSVNYQPDRYEREADGAAQKVLENLPAAGFSHGPENSTGANRPLPRLQQRKLEQCFGRDFSNVRIHNDSATGKQVAAGGARALTLGADIAFAPGQYAPGTRSGIKLLAHEVAHVVQQGCAQKNQHHSYQRSPVLSHRPAAIGTPQATLEVDPAKFTGANASQLSMDLAQFKRHITSELMAVTGLSVTFSGNQLVMSGPRASSSTAVRVLRLALNAAPPPYYIDPIPGNSGNPIQASGRRGIELGTGPFPAATLRAMRRGIIIIHEFAHVFSSDPSVVNQQQHSQRLRDVWRRFNASLDAQGRSTGTLTTEELNIIGQSGPPAAQGPVAIPVSQEIVPVDVSNRVRSELGLGIRRLTYNTPIIVAGTPTMFAQFLVVGSRPPRFIYQNAGTGELFVSSIDFMQRGARAGAPQAATAGDLLPIASDRSMRQHL